MLMSTRNILMQNDDTDGSSQNFLSISRLITNLAIVFAGLILYLPLSVSVAVPSSNCYVLDNGSHLLDFTDWIGRPFEYEGKDADIVVRFCKDVESRSHRGYIDFGRYASYDYFVAGSGSLDFVQGFYGGDLLKCENTFDKMGRNAQVNIMCGNCLNVGCKGELGCICNATYDETMCRVFVDLAIPCVKQGPRVFEGFTVGFNPRTSEVVCNGMTQYGYEKCYHEFSFGTEQTHVTLYLTAVSKFSSLIGKPSFKVYPANGLAVSLSGSGASGSAPTTLSPLNLIVDWKCEIAHRSPYEVAITVPVKGYDPIEFVLSKICDYTQAEDGGTCSGWATFGVLSSIFLVLAMVSCCAGFIYKIHLEHRRGLDALPGITVLSACLEVLSGPHEFSLADNANGSSINQASLERRLTSCPATKRPNERRYGSI